MSKYLRSIVRNGGKGRMGFGVELFRLDSVAEEDLTDAELEIAEEEKDQASSTALMRIYEDIGEDFWTGGGVTAKKFAEELSGFGDIKRLNVHINSLGGDAFTAQAIYSIISDHPSKKTAYIDGVAASAATIIACGADEVVARNNSNYMIHLPWMLAVGNADTMRKAAADLEATTVPIVSVYKEQVKGKIDEDTIKQLMEDETWMTADEALEYGFVDIVRGKMKAIAKASKTQILCSGKLMDIAKYHYRNVPKYPKAEIAKAEIKAEAEPQQKKEDRKMEIKDIDPQLLASIEADARTKERERLSKLNAMDGPGLEEIVARAIREGKQPEEIAMECFNVTKEQLSSAVKVNALAKDAQAASVVRAGDAPSPKPQLNERQKAVATIVNAFKQQGPRRATANNHGGN